MFLVFQLLLASLLLLTPLVMPESLLLLLDRDVPGISAVPGLPSVSTPPAVASVPAAVACP
jgi:hypothetical protein